MKKILLAVMAIAAIGFTSCGNKTQQAEATDSTEVAINPEEEANAVVDNLKAFVAAGDADQLAACLDKVKETVNKFAISDSVAAKAYAAAVQKYLIENAEQVKAIAQQHPFYAVFRDSGMATDSVMTNFEQIFETYSPKTIRRIL